MTIRNLDALFEPKSIAVIGASNKPRSVGAVLARNLFEAGFEGPIMAVNPHEQAIRSTLNYRSVAELPTTPDLAVLATPPPTIPGLIADLGARGCRAAARARRRRARICAQRCWKPRARTSSASSGRTALA